MAASALVLPLLMPYVDLNNLIAVFDADDTLWPQFGLAAKSAGVDPSKLDNFSVRNNRYYTEDEKARLFEAFRDVRLFEQVQFYPGIEKMVILHEMGIKIRIDSKSFTSDIREVKRYRFKNAMPFLQDSDLNLTISGQDHATVGKTIGTEVTFFVDDNPYNIITSDATYNLLPSKTWNSNPEERYRMRSKNFYILSGLDSIIEAICQSVRHWQKFYPQI